MERDSVHSLVAGVEHGRIHHHRRRRTRWKHAQKIAVRVGIIAFLILIIATLAYVWIASQVTS